MNLRSLLPSVCLLVAAASITGTIFTQTRVHETKQRKTVSARQFDLTAAPDLRSRKMPGKSEKGRDGKTGAGVFDSSQNDAKERHRSNDPVVSKMTRAETFDGDLRSLPAGAPVKMERPEREGPELNPQIAPVSKDAEQRLVPQLPPVNPLVAPTPSANFDGLDFANWGAGHPPDTNGDVGPTYFIQTVNTSIGIYDKTTGTRVAAFTFNTFMSQGNFGNLCDTDNFGDPVVLYDTFEDRWVITDFAFKLDASGNVVNPPGSFQCIAVSKTGDPVSGGWNFYSINTTGGLGDYPKLGVWTDGIYMSVNMFGYASGAAYQNPRVYAFNKSQMYAGASSVQILSFDAPSNDFTVLPSNARLQTGTPPAGRPNLFVSTEQFLNGLSVYKFHADWDHPSLSSFTGPDIQSAPTCWPNATPANVSTPKNALDTLSIRAMVQNQYSNIGGAESLWLAHTVNRGEFTLAACGGTNTNNATARWYQLNVSGGTVAANVVQGTTFDPEAANTYFRFMPSIAIDKLGDMALGYSKANSTTNPQIKYAGRLSTDPVNTITQTEQTLIDGAGSQQGNCGGGPCTRWGDYSAMTLDPDGCTFWYTSEYYAANGLNDLTRIGAFKYPSCVAFNNNGGLQGTVRSAATNQPLPGVSVSLGSRSTTTDTSGNYSFAGLPQGVYPSESAAFAGYVSGTASNLSISDGSITTQNFSLLSAADSSCFADTLQADFQTGSLNNADVSSSPNNVILSRPTVLDQSNGSLGGSGSALDSTNWWGQTFTQGITGSLKTADINLFCSGCTGTAPNLVLSIRATSGGLPTGADLATATLTGNSSGSSSFFTGTFSGTLTLNAGTVYALIVHPTSNPSAGTYAATFSGSNIYTGGVRVTSSNSGSTWGTPTGPSRDLGFHVYVLSGYAASGDFTSSTKDSNPAVAGTSTWGTLGWNATVPANTTLKFQVAASNSQFGPFNFVGPGGTAATFFTIGSSLAQFNALRYLQYKAFFTSTDSTVTPTLNDVTICNTNPRVWTGAVSSDWNNPSNWSSSGVPGSSDPAIIPSTGVLNNPLNTTSASVGSLMLGAGRIVTTGANSLTVTNCSTSAITGGNSTSYVKGTLIRCVNSAGPYTFPVGTGVGYAPVTLGGVVGSGTFLVSPVDGVLTGASPLQSIQRYWTITPSGPTQANITLSYQSSDVPGGANESAFQILHQNGSGTFGFAPTSFDVPTHTFVINGVTAFSNWSVGTPLAPTAANVSISGRVVNQGGLGVAGASLTLMDATGPSRAIRTNNFGYFTLDDIRVGRTYIASVRAKGYQFEPRVISVTDDIANLDFVALP